MMMTSGWLAVPACVYILLSGVDGGWRRDRGCGGQKGWKIERKGLERGRGRERE